ncbi:MBL fold metallo-hydrolase [Lacibacterium aquatile]|uniref:MBL fold metallo-hydrolase n=1 Tax=Lacibacterium aquatile TaxID=1168082 RepID=A0ABW5DXY1_9PROT
MQIETLGHAVMLLSRADGTPLLATDPWLIGSTYWRSWWVENYPSADDIARIAGSRYLYLTHEHPDHLHPPSLRKIAEVAATRPEVLVPDFLEMKMADYLAAQGWSVRRLPNREWVELEPGVRAMALPIWNNDSILLIDTPDALIANINDAKPTQREMLAIGDLKRRLGKRCIMLRSYSPAGPSNNYFRAGERLSSGKRGYLRAVQNACRRGGADDFIPFASQVVFRRPDTDWANDFKVRYADLEQAWKEKRTRLLRPYSRVDLPSGKASAQDPANFNPGVTERTQALVAEQAAANAAAVWTAEDTNRLEVQLRSIRWPLLGLLPRGFQVETTGVKLFWRPWAGRLVSDQDARKGHFTLRVPLLPLKEAVTYGHTGDLSIPMFTEVHLDASTKPSTGDAFFMLLILRDYGYLGSLCRAARWARWALCGMLKARRPLPL